MDASTPITVVATITVQLDSRDVIVKALLQAVTASRQEDGCEYYALHEDTEHPERLVMLERWRDEAALATHAEGPAFKTLMKVMDGKSTLHVAKLRAL